MYLKEINLKNNVNYLIEILKILKQDYEFSFNICAVHKKPNIELMYYLSSLKNNKIVKVKVYIDDKNPKIETSVNIFPSNYIHEQEIQNLFGVNFIGNEYTKTFYNADFNKKPLRKDYK
jgi:NADH:ubiquinone oxidoreductase subunit C